jgi:glycosyltransferase involved in cell wall biosynthesis
MLDPRRISIVTCSYNQGAFLARTIDSVLAQDYPHLEHIIVDGMSTDDTPRVLARYPHLRVIREPDRGQADAINKGFRLASGDILAFLNSDDTLAPGALWRVACEIDPARGRHVVMGRCRFIDEHDRFVGREHPCAFEGHLRMLEVWKGYCIPQPAVFWTREVWEGCGPLDEREQHVLDYDLFCRFSRHYPFHVVDQVLANYRLHARSKTCSTNTGRVLAESVRVSRKYWGGWWSPRFWRLLLSYKLFRFDRRGRGLKRYQAMRTALERRRWLAAMMNLAGFVSLTPDLFVNLLLLPAQAQAAPDLYEWFGLARLTCSRRPHPFTIAWLDYTGLHDDGCVGPRFEVSIDVPAGATSLRLEGGLDIAHLPRALELEVHVGGHNLGRHRIPRRSTFTLQLPLEGIAPGTHPLVIRANTFAVHADYRGNPDHRPLAFQLRALEVLPASPSRSESSLLVARISDKQTAFATSTRVAVPRAERRSDRPGD